MKVNVIVYEHREGHSVFLTGGHPGTILKDIMLSNLFEVAECRRRDVKAEIKTADNDDIVEMATCRWHEEVRGQNEFFTVHEGIGVDDPPTSEVVVVIEGGVAQWTAGNPQAEISLSIVDLDEDAEDPARVRVGPPEGDLDSVSPDILAMIKKAKEE